MEAFYRMYTARHRIVSEYFVQQVRAAAGSILDHEQPSQTAVENASDLIIASAMVGGLTRLLAEKLLLLEGQNMAEAAPAAEPAPDWRSRQPRLSGRRKHAAAHDAASRRAGHAPSSAGGVCLRAVRRDAGGDIRLADCLRRRTAAQYRRALV